MCISESLLGQLLIIVKTKDAQMPVVHLAFQMLYLITKVTIIYFFEIVCQLYAPYNKERKKLVDKYFCICSSLEKLLFKCSYKICLWLLDSWLQGDRANDAAWSFWSWTRSSIASKTKSKWHGGKFHHSLAMLVFGILFTVHTFECIIILTYFLTLILVYLQVLSYKQNTRNFGH